VCPVAFELMLVELGLRPHKKGVWCVGCSGKGEGFSETSTNHAASPE
jgi:hypothetical protein